MLDCRSNKALKAVLISVLVMNCTLAYAGHGATFESFYRTGFSISWVMTGLSAVLIGVLVFVGWPVLAPTLTAFIGSIGSMIGGLFGFTGIAATNFGLALLGGGAVATGGFGIAGGTALLAAALTFGTDVTLDYAMGALNQKYDEGKFAEASLKMMTLPLPQNTEGPASVKAAGKALNADLTGDSWHCVKKFPDSVEVFKRCVTAKQKSQRKMISDALAAMEAAKKSTSKRDVEREAAMLALLQFLNNDYIGAKTSSLRAYKLGAGANGTPTLPAFVYAASLLYDDTPNLNESYSQFQFSVAAEPENPLTPVLFATYLDRLSYRLNDHAAGVDQIDRLSRFADSLAGDDRKLAIQQTLLSHAFMQIKVSQQRVLSLTASQNRTVRENPRTIEVVRVAKRDYGQLIRTAADLIVRQNALIDLLSRDSSWWNTVKKGKNPTKGAAQQLKAQGWPAALQNFKTALIGYERDQKALGDRVAAFERTLADIKAQ